MSPHSASRTERARISRTRRNHPDPSQTPLPLRYSAGDNTLTAPRKPPPNSENHHRHYHNAEALGTSVQLQNFSPPQPGSQPAPAPASGNITPYVAAHIPRPKGISRIGMYVPKHSAQLQTQLQTQDSRAKKPRCRQRRRSNAAFAMPCSPSFFLLPSSHACIVECLLYHLHSHSALTD